MSPLKVFKVVGELLPIFRLLNNLQYKILKEICKETCFVGIKTTSEFKTFNEQSMALCHKSRNNPMLTV